MSSRLVLAVLFGVLGATGCQASGPPPSVPAAVTPEDPVPWLARHRSLVTGVEPLYLKERVGRTEVEGMRGAIVWLRPEPGTTAVWLQHTLSEYERALAAGSAPASECPIGVTGTRASVRERYGRFEVRIEGESRSAGAEILRRARLLVQGS